MKAKFTVRLYDRGPKHTKLTVQANGEYCGLLLVPSQYIDDLLEIIGEIDDSSDMREAMPALP